MLGFFLCLLAKRAGKYKYKSLMLRSKAALPWIPLKEGAIHSLNQGPKQALAHGIKGLYAMLLVAIDSA
jgi:hypothetical protein